MFVFYVFFYFISFSLVSFKLNNVKNLTTILIVDKRNGNERNKKIYLSKSDWNRKRTFKKKVYEIPYLVMFQFSICKNAWHTVPNNIREKFNVVFFFCAMKYHSQINSLASNENKHTKKNRININIAGITNNNNNNHHNDWMRYKQNRKWKAKRYRCWTLEHTEAHAHTNKERKKKPYIFISFIHIFVSLHLLSFIFQ